MVEGETVTKCKYFGSGLVTGGLGGVCILLFVYYNFGYLFKDEPTPAPSFVNVTATMQQQVAQTVLVTVTMLQNVTQTTMANEQRRKRDVRDTIFKRRRHFPSKRLFG